VHFYYVLLDVSVFSNFIPVGMAKRSNWSRDPITTAVSTGEDADLMIPKSRKTCAAGSAKVVLRVNDGGFPSRRDFPWG
jgi:hypothetical protein